MIFELVRVYLECVKCGPIFISEKEVIGVFRVGEFEPVLKSRVAPFLGSLAPIFARNFGLTPEHTQCIPKVIRQPLKKYINQ